MVLAEWLGLPTWNWIVIIGLAVLILVLLVVRRKQAG